MFVENVLYLYSNFDNLNKNHANEILSLKYTIHFINNSFLVSLFQMTNILSLSLYN